MRTTPEHPSPAAIHEKSDTAESAEVPDFAPDPSSSGPNIWFANRFPKVHKIMVVRCKSRGPSRPALRGRHF
jgi:hypothetical protein